MIFDALTLHNYGLYRGEHRILLSLNDESRNVTLFGGLNGAGKTTTIRLLLAMAKASSGSARVLGLDALNA